MQKRREFAPALFYELPAQSKIGKIVQIDDKIAGFWESQASKWTMKNKNCKSYQVSLVMRGIIE